MSKKSVITCATTVFLLVGAYATASAVTVTSNSGSAVSHQLPTEQSLDNQTIQAKQCKVPCIGTVFCWPNC